VFFCSESTNPLENRTGASLRAKVDQPRTHANWHQLICRRGTYDEKTCCETSLAGLDSPAPMVAVAEVLDACAEVVEAWEKSELSLALAALARKSR
jgi:hypothetical protein